MSLPKRDFGNWFDFSLSSWKTFRDCPRRWWWSKVGFWRGWEKNAYPPVRKAYCLSKMQNVWTLSGSIIHDAAAAYVEGSTKSEENARLAFEVKMRAAWNESIRGDWQSDPKRKTNLQEHYYGHEDAGGLFARALHRGKDRVSKLVASETVQRIREGEVLEVEALDRMKLPYRAPLIHLSKSEKETEFEEVGVWVQLDVAFRPPEDPNLVEIVDWKTGKPRSPDDRAQGILYALFAMRERGIARERIRIRLSYLGPEFEDDVFEPPENEIEALSLLIPERAADIQLLLDRPDVNRAPKENFPTVDDPEVCRRCFFYDPCKGGRRIPEGPR